MGRFLVVWHMNQQLQSIRFNRLEPERIKAQITCYLMPDFLLTLLQVAHVMAFP